MIARVGKNKWAQTILEYAVLIAVVSTAITAMYTYFNRAVNSRMEDLRQEYSPEAAGSD